LLAEKEKKEKKRRKKEAIYREYIHMTKGKERRENRICQSKGRNRVSPDDWHTKAIVKFY